MCDDDEATSEGASTANAGDRAPGDEGVAAWGSGTYQATEFEDENTQQEDIFDIEVLECFAPHRLMARNQ
jgi:hypothetical protein